ncbi:MAG TPA: DNA alkylation repair protein [Coriobacteriia bacterium]|nr:DNA alkylation repair protein [Coriobacteriia bacterium]
MNPAESTPTPESVAGHLIEELRANARPENLPGMARYGISTAGTLGVTMPVVRGLAAEGKRAVGRDPLARHALANALWASGIHEALIMAAVVDEPRALTIKEADARVAVLDSWDTCDQLCGNLLWKTPYAWELPDRWAGREETFVKRAGFVVITQLPKDKKAPDERFLPFLELCEREAFDPRNDAKKAINWAIRGIGKRSAALNAPAIQCAERILEAALAVKPATEASKAARWIARDAIRELNSEPVRRRLGLH